MSRVCAIISALSCSASSSACHGLLIITVITPLPTNPARQKCQRTKRGERGNYDMQMRQRDVAALDAKYTKELADAKAENDALRDDVPLVVVGCTSKQSVSQCVKATTASSVDNAASPTPADTAERDYFTLEGDAMQKQLGRNQKYINEQCR